MASKRQTTMAKLARERLVRERRALKAEKKQAAKEAARNGDDQTATAETTDSSENLESI
jgi:hypothetical protein